MKDESARTMAGAEVAFLQQFRALRGRFSDLLGGDPVCQGRVAGGTVDLMGELAALGGLSPVQALALGRLQERADVLAFLDGRRRAARTVADKNPDQAERAGAIGQQIAVEIDAIVQGLHELAAGPRVADGQGDAA